MRLNLIQRGNKLPADLSIIRLAHSQARPARATRAGTHGLPAQRA